MTWSLCCKRSIILIITYYFFIVAAWAGTTAIQSVAADPPSPGYWTAERMAAALPSGRTIEADRAPELGPAYACPASPYTDRVITDNTGYPYRTMGRLFYTDASGVDHYGSAVVVGRDVILTAGHCLHSDGGWHKNVFFIPAYQAGDFPYGAWWADELHALTGWTYYEWNCRDVGFVVLDQESGTSVGDVVGGLTMLFDQDPENLTFYQYGYPSNLPGATSGGEWLVETVSSFGYLDDDEGGSLCPAPIGVGSRMAEGCSGGPWLIRDGGQYYVVGLNSYQKGGGWWTSGCDESQHSPRFDDTVEELYQSVAGSTASGRVSLESYNYRSYYIRHANYRGLISTIGSSLDRQDATFNLVSGLAGSSYVSLESTNYPGYYLRHYNYAIRLSAHDSGDLFAQDASFKQVSGLADPSWLSLESSNYPGYYIRHYNYYLYIDQSDGSGLFAQDATFRAVSPLSPSD